MKIFFKKILIILILFLTLNSCSYFNKPNVSVTIDSDPSGAQIYINGILYGNSAKEIDLIPNKDYQLELVKEGYQTSTHQMKTQFSFRKGRERDKIRCVSDLFTSFLILPFFALNSSYCRDFVQRVYDVELTTLPPRQQFRQNIYPSDNVFIGSSPSFSLPKDREDSKKEDKNNQSSVLINNRNPIGEINQSQNQDSLMGKNLVRGSHQNDFSSQSFTGKSEIFNKSYDAQIYDNQNQSQKTDNKDYYKWK